MKYCKIIKIKAKEKKGLGLPPKKRSFKIKSLTRLLCLVRISDCVDISFLIGCVTRYGFNHCPLTVNAPVDSLQTSTAPLG